MWALLNNRHSLALIFWREAEDALALAMIGCNIYEKLSQSVPHYDTEGRLAMVHQKNEFEDYAKLIVDLCYTRSRVRRYFPIMQFRSFILRSFYLLQATNVIHADRIYKSFT